MNLPTSTSSLASVSPMCPPNNLGHLLFRLPQELRDLIYVFVLTEPHGLIADSAAYPNTRTRFLPANSTSFLRLESNQLRYVNKQLHRETNGLGLLFNDLTFADTWRYDTNRISAFEHFTRFASTCSARILARVRKITILDTQTFHTSYTSDVQSYYSYLKPTILPFCLKHPNTVVIIRLTWGDSILTTRYVACIDALACALRGASPLPRMPENGRGYTRELCRNFKFECPENLRFSCTTKFFEDRARGELAGYYEGKRMEDVLGIVRRMHERGV